MYRYIYIYIYVYGSYIYIDFKRVTYPETIVSRGVYSLHCIFSIAGLDPDYIWTSRNGTCLQQQTTSQDYKSNVHSIKTSKNQVFNCIYI